MITRKINPGAISCTVPEAIWRVIPVEISEQIPRGRSEAIDWEFFFEELLEDTLEEFVEGSHEKFLNGLLEELLEVLLNKF